MAAKRHADACAVQVIVAAFDVDTAVACGANALAVFRLQNPSGHEMVFNHAEPAGRGFADVFGFDLPDLASSSKSEKLTLEAAFRGSKPPGRRKSG